MPVEGPAEDQHSDEAAPRHQGDEGSLAPAARLEECPFGEEVARFR